MGYNAQTEALGSRGYEQAENQGMRRKCQGEERGRDAPQRTKMPLRETMWVILQFLL